MRQVILDTETTGLNPKKGDRIVEIGCLEMIDRRLTGRQLHYFLNPERDIPEEVVAIHGITNEQVKDAPKFTQIADELWQWLDGAELIIHNAAFDMGFLNAEYQLLATKQGKAFNALESVCGVLDTLKLAREKHPGSRVSLDALCKRYGIDNSHRTLHGAILDSEILSDVYLMLTGGQTDLLLDDSDPVPAAANALDLSALATVQGDLVKIVPTADELSAHQNMLQLIAKKSDSVIDWPTPD
jgi:DNA polymerase-3 subunit epsilon